MLLFASALAACGGGGNISESTPISTDPPPPANNAPVISGSPTLRTVQDQAYTFTPTASDADGDTLVFSINNQPPWADFDTASGTLSGSPAEIDIGTTLAVSISVSDGEASASLAPFDLEVLPTAFGSATVSWDAPTTNADGSSLDDLAGFRIHYGTTSNSYSFTQPVSDSMATSAVINDLEEGTYYFSVTAVDLSDNESAHSVEVSKEITP
jgi:hypothetical protein